MENIDDMLLVEIKEEPLDEDEVELHSEKLFIREEHYVFDGDNPAGKTNKNVAHLHYIMTILSF